MHSVSGFAGRLVPHAKGGIGVVESLGPRGTSPKGSKSDLADDNARLCQLLQSNQTLSSVGFSADPRPTQAYLATVQLGCLVLQVSGADNSIATGRDLASFGERRPRRLQLFPPLTNLRWPPTEILDDSCFIEATTEISAIDSRITVVSVPGLRDIPGQQPGSVRVRCCPWVSVPAVRLQ